MKYKVKLVTTREVYADSAEDAMARARQSGMDVAYFAAPVELWNPGLQGPRRAFLRKIDWLISWAVACVPHGRFIPVAGCTVEPYPITCIAEAFTRGNGVTIEEVESEEKLIARSMAL